MMKKIIRKLFGSVLRKLRSFYIRYLNAINKRQYHIWAKHNESTIFEDLKPAQQKDLVSVVVPVYNTQLDHLLEMINSVINQHYQNWELILADASEHDKSREIHNACKDMDTRINIVRLNTNEGISENTNAGLKEASGKYVAFLDHDDTLHPYAVSSLVVAAHRSGADIVYSDEDKVTHDGTFYFDPHCKPDWSPHLFENVNYINHFTLMKKSLVDKVGGLRKECDGAQDYDLLLRVTDIPEVKVSHVPRVLYHWRAAHTSTAADISNKTYIFKAGEKAISEHFKRKKIQATTKSIENRPGFYKTDYSPVENFSVIIGNVDINMQPACFNWLQQLLEGENSNIELIVGEWYRSFQKRSQQKNTAIIKGKDGEYLLNAAKAANNDVVIVFLDAAMPRKSSYLFELASVAKYSKADVVQPIIVGRDNTIIDAGLVDSQNGFQPLFRGKRYSENTFFGNTDWTRDISSVSGSVFALSKKSLEDLLQDKSSDHLFPKAISSLLWAHLDFEWQSQLKRESRKLAYFNSQLGQAMYDLSMKTSVWDDQRNRAND